jgi:hypothetical protein
MDFKKIAYDEAKQKISEYDYAIVHMISKLQYGKLEDIDINWDELLELRAFSDKGELRIYQGNDGKVAQCCTETEQDDDNSIVLKYDVKGDNSLKLMVKEYLKPDEDGQAQVVYTRPFAIV